MCSCDFLFDKEEFWCDFKMGNEKLQMPFSKSLIKGQRNFPIPDDPHSGQTEPFSAHFLFADLDSYTFFQLSVEFLARLLADRVPAAHHRAQLLY